MWTQNKSPQSGFTLVELAIVLVIIGLILAAVLKGQEMITNAKVKSVENDLRGVIAAYYAYQDRYKAIPGDDNAAASHAGVGAVNGNGDGLIQGLFNATAAPAAATESNNFWQHSRLAGFLTGSATATVANPPTNAVGGILGVQSDVPVAGTASVAIYGMTGNAVCVSNIPLKIALSVDILLDDGNSNTGTVRAGAAGATDTVAALSGAYGPLVAIPAIEGLHTLCMKI